MEHIPENLDRQKILEKVYAHFYNVGENIFESDNPIYDFEIEKSEGVCFGVIVVAYESERPCNIFAKHIAKECSKNTIIASVMVTKHGSMLIDVNTSKALLEGTFDFSDEDMQSQKYSLSKNPKEFIRQYSVTKAAYILSHDNYHVEVSPDPSFDLLVKPSNSNEFYLVYVASVSSETWLEEAKEIAKSLPPIPSAIMFLHIYHSDSNTSWDAWSLGELLPTDHFKDASTSLSEPF